MGEDAPEEALGRRALALGPEHMIDAEGGGAGGLAMVPGVLEGDREQMHSRLGEMVVLPVKVTQVVPHSAAVAVFASGHFQVVQQGPPQPPQVRRERTSLQARGTPPLAQRGAFAKAGAEAGQTVL